MIAVTVIHVITCFILVVIVLLQTGKGADMGAVFGGGSSSTIFGSSGAGNLLTKITTGAAIVFMATSLTLAYSAGHRRPATIFDRTAAPEAPAPAAEVAGEDAAQEGVKEDAKEEAVAAGAQDTAVPAAKAADERAIGFVGGDVRAPDAQRGGANPFDLGAEIQQQPRHHFDIGNPGHVAQRAPLIGQQARGDQRQRGVLVPFHVDASFDATTAFNDECRHDSAFLAPQPSAAGSNSPT